jgi:signal peptidase II
MALTTTARNAILTWSLVVAAIVADQVTKWWALRELKGGKVIELVPSLEFDLTYNSGFSFGTGGQFGRWIGVFVTVIAVIVAIAIVRSPRLSRARVLAVILGGALGNLLDRLFRADDGFLSGKVVDFIDVTWYAVFNVADMFVVCGSILLVYIEWRAAERLTPEVLD